MCSEIWEFGTYMKILACTRGIFCLFVFFWGFEVWSLTALCCSKSNEKHLLHFYFMLFGHKRGRTESKAKLDHLRTNTDFQYVQYENKFYFTQSDFSVGSVWWTTQVSSRGSKNNTITKVLSWGLRFSLESGKLTVEGHR